MAVEEVANYISLPYAETYSIVSSLASEMLLDLEAKDATRAAARLRTSDWPRTPLAASIARFVWHAPGVGQRYKQRRVAAGARFCLAPVQRLDCVRHTASLFGGVLEHERCGDGHPVYYPAEFVPSRSFVAIEAFAATLNLRLMDCGALLLSAFASDDARRMDVGGYSTFILAASDLADDRSDAKYYYGRITSSGRPGTTRVDGKLQSGEIVTLDQGRATTSDHSIVTGAVGRGKGGVWVIRCLGPWKAQ